MLTNLTQNVVQLVEVMLPREDGPVGEHLCQDAAYRPNINGLGVALQWKGEKMNDLCCSMTQRDLSA